MIQGVVNARHEAAVGLRVRGAGRGRVGRGRDRRFRFHGVPDFKSLTVAVSRCRVSSGSNGRLRRKASPMSLLVLLCFGGADQRSQTCGY